MKSSSFLCGVLLGAGAAIWASRRKAGTGLMSLMGGASTALKFAEQDKIDQSANHSSASYTHHQNSYKGPVTSAQEYPSSISSAAANHSKEYNLKQITDFIKGNGDVRKEVEAILKETNTVIPGI